MVLKELGFVGLSDTHFNIRVTPIERSGVFPAEISTHNGYRRMQALLIGAWSERWNGVYVRKPWHTI